MTSAALFGTPILFVIYRRPEATAEVFAAIRRAKPRRLFVAADGPRSADETDACARTRDVIQHVDWDCDLSLDFAEANLGLTSRMSSALGWFFESVDGGIVLEDDCLPSDRFFAFASELLDKYRDDSRVVHISGESYQPAPRGDRSYLFSKYPLIWGWASWRRAWRHFDLSLSTWPAFSRQPESDALFDSKDERDYWHGVFQRIHDGRLPRAWDYAWHYACMTQGLSIHPAANLIANIGYGPAATHTTSELGPLALSRRSFGELSQEIRHPAWIVRDREADQHVFEHRYGGAILKHQRTLRHQVGRPVRWLRRAWRSRR